MTTAVVIILVFGLLIAWHELGHYLMAKAVGMRVEEYALGFGPALASRRWGETLYALRVVPLGGYVRLAGMEGTPTADPRAFPNRPLWQRFVVILAGPLMNLILAVLLYAILFGPVGIPAATTTIAGTVPGYPARQAGIRPGARIVAVDARPVRDWNTVVRRITGRKTRPVRLTVVQDGVRRTVTLVPRWDPAVRAYIVGIVPRTYQLHLPPGQAVVEGAHQTAYLTAAWATALFALVTGRGPFQLTGPVGIAQTIGRATAVGWWDVVNVAAALSANLGLFNLLPIPVLDGSRLFLLGLEGVRHRALDPERENLIHMVGFVFLLLLVLVVTVHDIVHLLGVHGSA
ncbi:Membrane-associated zinc metalloprotease [Candidatus Hydrogenisulfobacillus filiaventi]|uniref:Membrane-associated zinc metalloprotease n=1 Tax=Candidatus Hydrogenisulfobacillus filiaventi TaxID=2707344 RepID=A0A6F8ZGH1_9FIRM|nr:M50 family metallopeptidase [Bacillota bacterium]CAB1128763.1 Membrane-associated zinc metalloprotease [Candidatus Hydrogenisulfobacillus filiaventi]